MRPQPNRRIRGRNNGNTNGRRAPNPLSRNYESNGPDVKIRGQAQQIADKYIALARDAQSAGDRVMAENYLQHAEHYQRIILSAQATAAAPFPEDAQEDDVQEVGMNFSSMENFPYETAQPDVNPVMLESEAPLAEPRRRRTEDRSPARLARIRGARAQSAVNGIGAELASSQPMVEGAGAQKVPAETGMDLNVSFLLNDPQPVDVGLGNDATKHISSPEQKGESSAQEKKPRRRRIARPKSEAMV